MKFSLSSLSALAAFAATAFAQTADFNPVTSPEPNQEIPAGKPFKITWTTPEKYADGTVSLHLIGGDDQNSQVPISDIAAGIPNADGAYTWEVDASLGDANVYGLVVKWEADPEIFQYSNPFHIEKAEGGDDKGSKTTTIKKDYGIKTITLSSCDCEETPTSTVTPPAVEKTPEVTPTPTPTSTFTVQKPTTIKTKPAVTQTKEVEQVPPKDEPTDTPETIPEEGAGVRFGASSVALVGAFVVAALSL